MVATTLARLDERQRGIILFHDIKPATAKALPTILTELKMRGYKVVHMRAKAPARPLEQHAADLQPLLAKKDPPRGAVVAKAAMLPFFGATGPEKVETATRHLDSTSTDNAAATDSTEVVTLSPPPRPREAKPEAPSARPAAVETSVGRAKPPAPRRRPPEVGEAVSMRNGATTPNGWSTRVRRQRLDRTYFD